MDRLKNGGCSQHDLMIGLATPEIKGKADGGGSKEQSEPGLRKRCRGRAALCPLLWGAPKGMTPSEEAS